MVESPGSGSRKLAFEAEQHSIHDPERLPITKHHQSPNHSHLSDHHNRKQQAAAITTAEPTATIPLLLKTTSSLSSSSSASTSSFSSTFSNHAVYTAAITQSSDRSEPEFSRANNTNTSPVTSAATTATRQNKQLQEWNKAYRADCAAVELASAVSAAAALPAAALARATGTDSTCQQVLVSSSPIGKTNSSEDFDKHFSDLIEAKNFTGNNGTHKIRPHKEFDYIGNLDNSDEKGQLDVLLNGNSAKHSTTVNIAPIDFNTASTGQQLQQVDYAYDLSSTDNLPDLTDTSLVEFTTNQDNHESLSTNRSTDIKDSSTIAAASIHEVTTDPKETSKRKSSGFNLRALSDSISALENNPWVPAHQLTNDLNNATVLSNELVNETLNYFVNCRQRSNQMTKTYDDNDAYILLLQEKEVDLELAARIGQDLLKQNNQLKDSIKSLREELAKRDDDVQQLRHELSSKISLLDTFIEEEEHQVNRRENASKDDVRQQQLHIEQDSLYQDKKGSTSTVIHYATTSANQNEDLDEDLNRGFSSLDYNATNKLNKQNGNEAFSSLPYHLDGHYLNVDRDNSYYNLGDADSSADPNNSGIYNKSPNTSGEKQKLFENVTFQLVECNKRLCELQDELLYKSEQNISQQQKIFNLQQQLSETERRLDQVSTENETLKRSMILSEENQKDMVEELKNCKRNLNELLGVFLELQRETRQHRDSQVQSGIFFNDQDQIDDANNISYDSFNTTNSSFETQTGVTTTTNYDTSNGISRSSSGHQYKPFHNRGIFRRGNSNTDSHLSSSSASQHKGLNALSRSVSSKSAGSSGGALIMSVSLHEELQESKKKSKTARRRYSDDDEDDDDLDEDFYNIRIRNSDARGGKNNKWDSHLGTVVASDDDQCGRDSGVHTINRSSSVTPSGGLRDLILDEATDSDGQVEVGSDRVGRGPNSDSGTWSSDRRANNSECECDDGAANRALSPITDPGDKNWMAGLSSFTLCTLLLLCLSVTLGSTSNSNLASKFQIKMDK